MFGADIDFATPIQVQDEGRGFLTLTRSNQPGIDASGDGSADTYEIDEPLNSAPLIELGGGTIVFLGGQAIFVGLNGPNQSTKPADDSIGQADGWNLVFGHQVVPDQMNMLVAPGGGSAVRRQKVSENNSPIPRDRLIFNYHFFNNVGGGIGDVNRYTIGWESTLLDGGTSFEFRLPFAGTLSSDQTIGGITARDTELGNLSLIFKHIVLETDDQVWAMGLGINAPTARHTVVRFPSGATAVRWRNDAVHLLPYIGAVGTPTDQIFWQGFLQMDIDTAGNRIDADAMGLNAQPIGIVQDPNLLFADFSIGTWLFDDPDASFITGIAPLFEMHYSTTLQDADTAAGNGVAVSSLTQRFDVLNLSAAAVIRIGDRMSIRPGIVVPVRRNHDKQFDYEAGVQINIF